MNLLKHLIMKGQGFTIFALTYLIASIILFKKYHIPLIDIMHIDGLRNRYKKINSINNNSKKRYISFIVTLGPWLPAIFYAEISKFLFGVINLSFCIPFLITLGLIHPLYMNSIIKKIPVTK